MGGEGLEQEERRGKKKKGKHQEGEKAESSRRGDEGAVERDLSVDTPSKSEEVAVMDIEKVKEVHKRKKEKGHGKEKKNKGNDGNIESLADSSATAVGAEKEQVKASGLMVEQHCLEPVEDGMKKCDMKDKNMRNDKKLMKKKEGRKTEITGNKQVFGSPDENLDLEHAEVVKGEKKQAMESKKSKRKRVDSSATAVGAEKEQVKALGLMVEQHCLEPVEGGMTKCDMKDKKMRNDKKLKKKKKGRQTEMTGNKQVFGSPDENLDLEHAEVDKGEKKQATKSKKSKRKRVDCEPAADVSAGDLTNKDKKKRRNESDKFNPDGSHNTLSRGDEAFGDGKNHKKKKESKEGNGGKKSVKERKARRKDKVRQVRFSDDVEVFSFNGGEDEENDKSGEDEENDKSGESEVVHGKRFTPEENATLMEAIKNYAEMKQLGENGLEMIRASSKYPELKGCWAEIAKSLPHRPLTAIYKRARILLYMSDERKWTQEEYEKIRRHVEKNGTSWISLARELGKSEIHLKDTWRRMKPKNLKAGAWTQDEYQNLFDLVNLDLRMKAHQEDDASNRQLRDNIAWEAISDKLSTRNHKNCCIKWYYQLASPLVQKGMWADTDDYRLVEALQNVDAVCVEDVDWDSLLDHRSGEVCRKRWNELVRNIGGHKEKPFIEQVEVLSQRYCPEMLDYRKKQA